MTGFLRDRGTVTGVRTTHGDVEAEYVVNCAGMWARQLGELAGVSIPLQAAEHYYLLTEPIAGVDSSWPVLEDPASYGYYREEGGGLMLGLFEPVCAPWRVDGIPADFSFGELPPDWDRMGPYLEKTMARVPVTEQTGIRKFFCGPESFTPDLLPIIGEAPELRNYLRRRRPELDRDPDRRRNRPHHRPVDHRRHPGHRRHGMNIDRLHPYQANPEYRATRTVESLGLVYATHYPNRPDQDRARRAAVADPRQAGRAAGLLPRRQRLGGRRLVRAGRGRARAGRADLGPAALVRLLGGRASRHPQRRDRDGHVVHGQVPVQGRDAGRELERISRTRWRPSPAGSPTPSG